MAQSKTANSITGDIRLSPTRLRMAGVNVSLQAVSDLPHYRASDNKLVPARIFEVKEPRDFKLLNGNTFGCGTPVNWIVVWQFDGGKQLGMDIYDGAMRPKSDDRPLAANDTFLSQGEQGADFCASYYYVRPE